MLSVNRSTNIDVYQVPDNEFPPCLRQQINYMRVPLVALGNNVLARILAPDKPALT
jgi:hypothetical protein